MALGGAIKLKGESEYRRALDLIKQNLREVSSEMKIVTSTYDKNDTSTEALSAKSDVLNKRLEEQKSKLKLVSDQYKLYQDAVKQSADEHIQLGEKLENAKEKLASIEAQCGENSKEYEKQKKAVDDLQEEYDESTKAQDANAKSLSQLAVEMNNTQADVIKTTKQIDNLGKESDGSAKQVDDLSKKMGDAGVVTKGLNDGFTVLKGTMANLASQAISKVVDGFKELVGGAVDYQKSMEYYTTSFTVMTGSADKASETVKKLADIGATTPFDMPQLADATSLLMNFGFSADDAVDSMMMLGDISQGNADKLDTIARAYGKMNSAQKVTLENINMMIDAGFNPLQEISEKTGESMQSLYDRVSKGKMSVDEITESMKRSTSEGGKYFQSMDAQSQTLDGRLSTLSDTINSKLGEALQPILQKAADEWIPNITNAIDNMDIDSVVSVIDDLISGVGDLFGYIMDNGDTIISLVAGIGTAMVTWNVASMINGVVTAVKAYQEANEGATVAQALLNGVLHANPIMFVVTLLSGLVATIITLWNTNEGFRNAVINVWNAFKDTVGNVITSVGGFIDNLISWFQALPGRIGAFLGEVIGNVQNWASSMVSRASEAGSNFVGNVVSFISGLPSAVWNWLSNALNNVRNFAGQLAQAGANAASGLVNNIIDKVRSLPGQLYNWGVDMIQGIADGIKSAIHKVTSAVSDVADKIKSFLHFSRPDEGPLAEYESWMPDMVEGLSDSLRKASPELISQTEALANGMSDAFNVNGSISASGGRIYDSMVEAFKEALSQVKIEMDDEEMGHFVDKTVTKLIYN
jgi:tape measure domain-containing protein|nr:MAG TPA: tail tape measure protein [Caudoviricetes sp.]